MKNIKEFVTQDGSVGLYNEVLDEIYHSKFGAKTESYEKFIEPCLLINNRKLKILDICYGIGYNTKTAIRCFKDIELIDCIEINEELIKNSFHFKFSNNINKIIEDNIKNPDFIHFYIDDVRKIIDKLNKKYDIVFHDGFAPYKQPELWSEELILKISKLMNYNSIYVTYNHSKPVLNALSKAGLKLGKTIKNGKIIGIVASFDLNLIKNPLDDYEMGELNTKSAITYKDELLNSASEEIIENRKKEILNSKLQTLSNYQKIINHGNK